MMSNTQILQRDQLDLSALVDYPEIEYAPGGIGNSPVAMLVHGFPDTPHSWGKVAQGLVQAGYTVVRPWLRGYTPASVKHGASYDPYTAGLDLLAWRDMFAGRKVHLVGHDWGAVAAMAAVATQANAWETLSLLAIPPFQRVERAWRLLPRQMVMSQYMLEMQAASAPVKLAANQFGRVRALWSSWSPGWKFTNSDIDPVLEAFSNPKVAWAATRYYRSLFTLHRVATRSIYASSRKPLNVPTLAMAGQDDGCMQAALLNVMIEPTCFPRGIRSEILSNCGHFLHAEQPDAVLSKLLAHFDAQ
ncbi:alpha/beta fold hydrolase [Limnobacter parvus]|uniref:Alpha/beta hydrolase n=1 Tax=Limnobacter parvus TaxID=2939690 RepID=A0ABT1XFQ7_9BURK|nr:alpha/beta hydrolase [Limnobacter parvus]MCR2745696.1 alpha/beta hydrolase [Limnobacter parvus]